MDPVLSRLDGHDSKLTSIGQDITEMRQDITEIRQDITEMRQETKHEFAAVRQEMQEIRCELKDEIRGLHVRFEGLESTMRLVAERVGDFNRENQTLRGRVNTLETQQINTDLRLMALERKKRKS